METLLGVATQKKSKVPATVQNIINRVGDWGVTNKKNKNKSHYLSWTK